VRRLEDGRRHVLHVDRPRVCKDKGFDLVLLPMERAEKSFRDWLTETKQAAGIKERLEEGLALLRQACRGVAALHRAGIVHLDLKPENLLLTRTPDAGEEEATEAAATEAGATEAAATDWTVKVADFGLARSLKAGEDLNPDVIADGVGTPHYMAPEQIFAARQKDVGPEADVYSLGVMLFELLDGDRPFDGAAEAVRRKHQEVEPPSIATGAPQSLKELAQACLRKTPGERPGSIEAVAEQLTPESSEERAEEPGTGRADTLETQGEAPPTRAAKDTQAPASHAPEQAPAEPDPAKAPDPATRRRVERALERGTLDPVEKALSGGDTGVRAALAGAVGALGDAVRGERLRAAAAEGHAEITEVLLQAGADPERAGDDGTTPLHHAAFGGHTEVVQILLEEWADPDRATEDGYTDDGYTPLHRAAFEGHAEVAQMLLDAGADPNRPTDNGRTPLHGAASRGHTEVAQTLLNAGADPNRPTYFGGTPLSSAAYNGHIEVAQVLLNAGADPNTKLKARSTTPLDEAEREGHDDVARLLRRHGGQTSDELDDDQNGGSASFGRRRGGRGSDGDPTSNDEIERMRRLLDDMD
jgi:cytohesin